MNEIVIHINGHGIPARSGQSIMQAADMAGIVIPRLCFHPAVRSSGACRLCAVEIEGFRGLPAACSTEVADGMRITTDSQRVLDFRREMLLSILKEHPRECLACPRNGTCELQQLINNVGIDFPYEPHGKSDRGVKETGPYFERDYRLCVHCGRCVRVCHEVRGNRAIVFREVGGRQEVATRLGRSLAEAGCQFCGACVDVCPVGALREVPGSHEEYMAIDTSRVCSALTDIIITLYKKQLRHEQRSSRCTLCSAACPMIFDVAGGKILKAKPEVRPGLANGQACVQGRFILKSYINSGDRLKNPAVLKDGKMQEVTWDEAVDAFSAGLRKFQKGEIAVLTDTGGSNEGLASLRALEWPVYTSDEYRYFMTIQELLEDVGAQTLEGVEKGLEGANGILVLGVNLAGLNPILSVAVRRSALRGALLVTANPLETALGRVADLNLAYYPGSEEFLLKGLLRLLLNNVEGKSRECLLEKKELISLRERLAGYDLQTVSENTGLSEEILSEAACLLGRMSRTAVIFGGGFFNPRMQRESLKAIEALAAILNGREKTAIVPVYAGPNNKGAECVGLFPMIRGGVSQLPKEVKAALVVMRNISGRNPGELAARLQGLEYVAVMAERMPKFKADVVLPLSDILETGGSFTDFTGTTIDVGAVVSPPGGARPLEEVVKRIAAEFSAGSPQRPMAVEGAITPAQGMEARFAWEPSPFEEKAGERAHDQILALFSKDAFISYFLGPLLAEEATRVFHGQGEIEMNPSDAYSMALNPGDRILLGSEDWEIVGTLAVNSLLAKGVVAVRGEIYDKAFKAAAGVKPIFCKAAKVQRKE